MWGGYTYSLLLPAYCYYLPTKVYRHVLRRLLIASALAVAGLGLLAATAWADCTYTVLGNDIYVSCSGSGYSYSGTISRIGSYWYESYSGRANGKYFTADTTSTTIGQYTYSDVSGRVGSDRWTGTGTSYSVGSFTYGDYRGRIGDWSYSGSSTSSRLGSSVYIDSYTTWRRGW